MKAPVTKREAIERIAELEEIVAGAQAKEELLLDYIDNISAIIAYQCSLKEQDKSEYVDINEIKKELENSKKIFKLNNLPSIDVTRKSVEETAASIINIFEIKNKKNE